MPNGNFFSVDATPILPSATGALILDPLRAGSVALHPSVSQATLITTRSWTVPVVAADAAASWVAEGSEIAPSNPVMRELQVVPAKVAGLVPVSRETMNDSSPAARAVVGESLAESIRLKVDAAFLGAVAAPAPQGLGSTEPTVIEAELDTLDAFFDAKAASAAAGGVPSAVILHPSDATALYKLKTATGSNQALVGETNTIAGLPLVLSNDATPGQVWVTASNKNFVVIREDIEVTSDDSAYFTSDRTAVRAVMRVGFGFAAEAANVRIDVTPAA